MVSALVRMVTVSDSGPRVPGFDTRESLTLLRLFNGCHDYSTHDMSDNGETVKGLMVRRKFFFFFK